MRWQDALKGDCLPWLLEPDEPGVRYLALRDLVGLRPDDPELITAREQAHRSGPIATILSAMNPDGYWVEPGPGYNPKYHSTVWALIALAQLGASANLDERITAGIEHLLEHALTENGQFGASGTPSSTADCIQGNLITALLDLGVSMDRLEKALDWMARTVTGDGISPMGEKDAPLRYYAGKCGPGFACGANNKQPCAWGAVKVLLAFSRIPLQARTTRMEAAIQQGVDFLFRVDPATAAYPTAYGSKPNQSWWKFGFPVFYITDLLQLVEALVRLGFGSDPRLENVLNIIIEKQDPQGRWPLEYDYAGKTWVDYGVKKQPNKWVSWRARNVLQR